MWGSKLAEQKCTITLKCEEVIRVAKICPVMSNVVGGHPYGNTDIAPVPCLKHECELWIDHVYSSPEVHRMEGRCALRFLAEKNAEGKLPI